MSINNIAICRQRAVIKGDDKPNVKTASVVIKYVRGDNAEHRLSDIDLFANSEHTILVKHNNEWKMTNYGDDVYRETDGRGNPYGVVELPQGSYLIKGRTTYRKALSWSGKFTVNKDNMDNINKIILVYNSAQLTRCKLTISGNNVDNATIVAKPNIGVKRILNNKQVLSQIRKLKVSSGDTITFYLWPDIRDVYFEVRGYEYLTSEGKTQNNTIAVKNLIKGAEWDISVRKMVAKINVLVQTNDGHKPLTMERRKTVFPEIKRDYFQYILLKVKDEDFIRTKDGGHYDWNTGVISYAFLTPGKTYVFPRFAKVGRERIPLQKGLGDHVTLKSSDTVYSMGSIVLKPRSANTWTIKGTVKDANGNPVHLSIVSAADPLGHYWSTTTDKRGRYSITTREGDYKVKMLFTESKPKYIKLYENKTVNFILNSK